MWICCLLLSSNFKYLNLKYRNVTKPWTCFYRICYGDSKCESPKYFRNVPTSSAQMALSMKRQPSVSVWGGAGDEWWLNSLNENITVVSLRWSIVSGSHKSGAGLGLSEGSKTPTSPCQEGAFLMIIFMSHERYINSCSLLDFVFSFFEIHAGIIHVSCIFHI